MTQNVMGAVDFDGRFVAVLAGWEGSAHDAQVLRRALDLGFTVPQGRYYLVDGGYAPIVTYQQAHYFVLISVCFINLQQLNGGRAIKGIDPFYTESIFIGTPSGPRFALIALYHSGTNKAVMFSSYENALRGSLEERLF